MRRRDFIIIHILLPTILLAAPQRARAGETISVAAAISLRDALTKIGEQFAANTGDQIDFNFGGSGQLLAQIKNGAPVDVFISAADAQVDVLEKSGNVVAGSRRVI